MRSCLLIFFFFLALSTRAQDSTQIQFWDTVGNSGSTTASKITDPRWNKVAFVQSPAVLISPALKTTAGVQGTITVAVNQINDFSNNTISYGASNTMGVPDTVMAEAMYNAGNQTWTVGGLTNGQQYQVQVVSSAGTGTSAFTEVFAWGALKDTINAHNNQTNLVVMDNLSPVSGSFTFTITGSFSIVNAIRIIRKVSSSVYYFSSSSGSDAGAGTFASPYATSGRFNALVPSLRPGDSVVFKRGDIFPGIFTVTASGTLASRIFFDAYGSGPNPVWGGLTALTLTGSGPLYTATCPVCTANTNVLFMDNRLQTLARTPDYLTGYYIANSATTTVITDSTNLPGAPSLIGKWIVFRSSPFTKDKRLVTGQTTYTLTVTVPFTYAGVGGIGWMIIGDTPNSQLEWAYSGGVGGTVSIYVSDALSNHTAAYVAGTDTVMYATGQYLTFSNITMEGGNVVIAATSFQAAGRITLQKDSLLVGFDGLICRSTPGVTMTNCFVGRLGDDGLIAQNLTATNYSLLSNTFKDIGMWPGMGASGNSGTYLGVLSTSDTTVIKYNTFDSIGYIGVYAGGKRTHVDTNSVTNYCQNSEDGGGIYMHDASSITYDSLRTIVGNFIANGGGPMSHNGVSTDYSTAANGVYLDAFTQKVLVSNNTVSYVNSTAYYDHGPNNIFNYDTSFNSGYAEFQAFEYSGGPTITGLSVKHCVLVGVSGSSLLIKLQTVNNDLGTFGAFDSSQFVHAVSTIPFFTKTSADAGTARSFTGWKSTLSGYDAHSAFQNSSIVFIGNPAQSFLNVNLTAQYTDILGNQRSGGVTVAALKALLLKLGGNSRTKFRGRGKIHYL